MALGKGGEVEVGEGGGELCEGKLMVFSVVEGKMIRSFDKVS